MSTHDKREEQTKLEVAQRWFADYDCTHILGNIDFSVAVGYVGGSPAYQPQLFETEYFLWAEAKRGTAHSIEHSLVQLIITIGKARTYLDHLPPAFLGAFDDEKIAFVPYYRVADIFTINDFDWKVAPSDHKTKEFDYVLDKVQGILRAETLVYNFVRDAQELRQFIRENFVTGKSDLSRVRINKNNFTAVYQKWRVEVMPSIAVNWDEAKKQGIIAADFYLADILSEHNTTLLHRLYVLLRSNHYEFARRTDESTLFNYQLTAEFRDGQEAHRRFWQRYDRPPRREYWDYIVERRDLLVPQDVRERKGSFFTPQRWVELSQQYLADELGDDWQDRYYIWDCCAGTGNLLAGLTNKYNIYASTLDRQDVDVMHERIHNMNGEGGSNLLESHVFQFDFLNDPLLHERDKKGRIVKRSKVPDSLQEIITDPEKRKRLVIYINPPYAEAASTRTKGGHGENKKDISRNNKAYDKYSSFIGAAANELYSLFLIRVYSELKGVVLGYFGTLKEISSSNFGKFRNIFKPKFNRGFIVPAYTFDNVTGRFPIGFFVWNTNVVEQFQSCCVEVFDENAEYICRKDFFIAAKNGLIIDWLRQFFDNKSEESIGYLRIFGTDVQNNDGICILSNPSDNDIRKRMVASITRNNLIPVSIYYSARRVIIDTWINHRDQFLHPNDGWQEDYEFQTDCLVYTLFHGQNRITGRTEDRIVGNCVPQLQHPSSASAGTQMPTMTNHWIPFTEEEVDARERFDSHFMSDYLSGGTRMSHPRNEEQASLFGDNDRRRDACVPIDHMSDEAAAVMAAGRELWRYYHSWWSTGGSPVSQAGGQHSRYNPNASFYDIRLHFQGTKTSKSGKEQMNPASDDPRYTALLATLRQAMKRLAARIEPKVYQYGFLK